VAASRKPGRPDQGYHLALGEAADRPGEVMPALRLLVEGQQRIERQLELLNGRFQGLSPGVTGGRMAFKKVQAPLEPDMGELRSPDDPGSRPQHKHDVLDSKIWNSQGSGQDAHKQLEPGDLVDDCGAGVDPGSVGALSLAPAWPRTVQRRRYGDSSFRISRSDIDSMMEKAPMTEEHNAVAPMESLCSIESETKSSHPRFMLDPNCSMRVAFDVASLFVLLYDLIGLPVIMAWEIHLTGYLQVLSILTTVFWILDLVLNFRTGYYYQGRLVMNPRPVAWHYLRTWFVLDFLVLVCNVANFLVAQVEEGGTSGMETLKLLRFAKVGRLLRVAGLLRIARIIDVLERFEDRRLSERAHTASEVINLMLCVIFVNHFIACIWYTIGRTAPADTDLRWLHSHIGADSNLSYEDVSMPYQYWTSFHWSFTQMTPGSMQVHATNSFERSFTVFCLILGMVFFSSIVSALSSKTAEFRKAKQDKTQKLRTLQKFLESRNISTPLAVAVQKQVKERMEPRRLLTVLDVPLLGMLSEKLLLRLRYEMCRKYLTHPLLRWWEEVDPAGIKLLCSQAIDFVALDVGDLLFSPSSKAEAAHIVTAGRLKYSEDEQALQVSETDLNEHYIEKGDWICEAALWTCWTHVGSAEALVTSEVMSVNVQKLEEVLQGRRAVSYVLQAYATVFHERILTAKPPRKSWPTDYEVPCTGFSEILPFLPIPAREIIAVIALRQTRFTRIWQGEYDQLTEEVKEGKCAVMLNETGQVERIEVVPSLRLRRPDDKILVQLGVMDGGTMRVRCKLPGRCMIEGEAGHQAMQRLLAVELAPLAHVVHLEEGDSTLEHVSSARSVFTKSTCLRMVYEAKLNTATPELALSPFSIPMPTAQQHQNPFAEEEAFLLAGRSDAGSGDGGCQEFTLYTWLTNDEFEHLSSDKGERQLSTWLSGLEVGQRQLDVARSHLPP